MLLTRYTIIFICNTGFHNTLGFGYDLGLIISATLAFLSAPQVSRMLEEHDWIHSERQFFGQPNTSYDFKTNNPREAGQRLKKLEETTTKLERNVNKRAMNMLNEAEERVRTDKSGCGRLWCRAVTSFFYKLTSVLSYSTMT